MDKTQDSNEKRKDDYFYMPYWIIRLEQIIEEVKKENTEKNYR